jgi:hypothetical protein
MRPLSQSHFAAAMFLNQDSAKGIQKGRPHFVGRLIHGLDVTYHDKSIKSSPVSNYTNLAVNHHRATQQERNSMIPHSA